METSRHKAESKTDEFYRAEQLASRWLYLANLANERGDYELERRHLDRAQKWLDKMNALDGLA